MCACRDPAYHPKYAILGSICSGHQLIESKLKSCLGEQSQILWCVLKMIHIHSSIEPRGVAHRTSGSRKDGHSRGACEQDCRE